MWYNNPNQGGFAMSESREYYTRQLQIGSIHVSEEVVASIAAAAVLEVEGVVSLSATAGDIQELLSKKNSVKGIRMTTEDDALVIACSVVVLYGFSMQEIGAAIQDAVMQAVESMTGITVRAVHVNISGISMAKKQPKAE